MPEKINIAVVGFGNIGSYFYKTLEKNKNIKIFIGKEKSPSCGIKKTSAYINGCECKCDAPGLTSKILKEEGTRLISEWDLS